MSNATAVEALRRRVLRLFQSDPDAPAGEYGVEVLDASSGELGAFLMGLFSRRKKPVVGLVRSSQPGRDFLVLRPEQLPEIIGAYCVTHPGAVIRVLEKLRPSPPASSHGEKMEPSDYEDNPF